MNPVLQESKSEISGLDGTLNLSQDISSAKRLELLTTIMKILSSLKNLTASQLERAYRMAVKDLKYKLEEEDRIFLLHSLSQLKIIKRIISIQEDEATSLEALICLAQTNDNQLIYSVWSVDFDDRKNIQERLESLNGKSQSQKAYIICLDSKEIQTRSIENRPPIMQSSIASSSFLGNSSSSASNEAKIKAVQAVKEKLQNYPLHSDGLIHDFGGILFKEMFDKLLADPNEKINKKWIGMLKQPISDNWTHPCLQALRWYYRKF